MSEAATLDLDAVLLAENLSRTELENLRRRVGQSVEEQSMLRAKLDELKDLADKARDPGKKKDYSLALGAGLWVLGRVSEAVTALQEVSARRDAAYLLGKCLLELGQYGKAAEFLEKAKRTDDGDFEIEMDIVEAKRKSGDVKGALKVLHKYAKSHENTADYHCGLGGCLASEGQYEEALDEYKKALDINPLHAKSLFEMAYSHDLRGEDELAIELYEKTKQIAPGFPNALINLAVLYEDKNEYHKAVECLKAVLRANPNHPRAKLFLRDAEDSLRMYYDEESEKRADRWNRVLEIPISDFELSVRSRNCLERMRIRTLGDLTRTTELELLAYKNFGETSLGEIKAMLSQYGLRLGQALEEVKKPDETEAIPSVGDREALDRPLAELGLCVRAKRCMDKLEIHTIGDLVQKTEQELLDCKNFGQTSLKEVREKLQELGLSLSEPVA
ncbi:MAG: tetratricopeptide repeat protein [Planctomycetes bacterium]|nr:tetratricopeptide repeat protein [Planctomycetota bacterium]